jgi:hypothetical protein
MDWSRVTQVGQRVAAWFQRLVGTQEAKAQQDRDAVAQDLVKSEQQLLQQRRAIQQAPSNRM